MTKIISGLSDIIDIYDTFILDQWGVMHNGSDAFEFAIEALEFLQEENKKVVILSNSGKSQLFSYERLDDSGIKRDLYIDVVTSGSHMRDNFKSGKFDYLGKNALFFPWDNDYSVMEELNLTETDAENAEFILCTGVDRGDVEEYLEDLDIAVQKGLELVVSNPDIVAMNPDGYLKPCPGAIAQAYEKMGGLVHWHGKPQVELYGMCKDIAGGWDNAIAVGDSLEHDVAGANASGISSLFIESGIHNKDLKSKTLKELSEEFSVQATYTTKWFAV